MLAVHRFCLGSSLLVQCIVGCENRDPLAPSLASSKNTLTGVAPTNLAATAASDHQIWLAWQDNSTNEDGWEVYRSDTGPTGPFALFTVYPWPNVNAGGNDLLQGSTQYCYKVRAYKGAHRQVSYSGYSNVACVTTLAAPGPPAAPSAVSAAPSPFGVDVTWTDNATDETGFRVERSATAAGPWTLAGTTGANVTSLLHRQYPGDDQAVCYRVFAVNALGSSDGSAVDCTAAPTPPTNLAASSGSDGGVDLTWTDNSSVEDGYQVLRAGSSGQGPSVVATLPANTTSYRDAGLVDSSYGYNVRATKDGGASGHSYFVQVVVATVPPSAPTNADAVPAGSSVVMVTWVDMAMNEESTRVEHSIDGGATWITVATVGWYRWSSSSLDGAPSYEQSEQQVCYRVIAFNRIGDSPPSNTDCTTPPAGPTEVTATGVGAVTVDFAWRDNSGAEDGYVIARFVDYGDGYWAWEYLATVGPNTTSYRLEGYPSALYETYGVAALKDGGTSDWSSASPTPPSSP